MNVLMAKDFFGAEAAQPVPIRVGVKLPAIPSAGTLFYLNLLKFHYTIYLFVKP